jgi:phage terminase small subunit
MAKRSEDELNENQKRFCKEYILDWNGTRSYKVAYPNTNSDNAAGVEAHKLLRNPKIQEYIEEIQKDIAKEAGISRLMVANELKKLAFSSISHLHLNWLERKEFDQLTEDQKACISEIDTKILKKNIGTNDSPEIVDVEYVKIKLYDKQKAMEGLRKMLGFDTAEKIDLKHEGEVNIPLIKWVEK